MTKAHRILIPIMPINPGAHPLVFNLLNETVDEIEGKQATDELKKKGKKDLDANVTKVMDETLSKGITPLEAANRLNALTESGLSKHNIKCSLLCSFSREKDFQKKAVYAKVFEKFGCLWDEIISSFEYESQSKTFYIKYLKELADDELKKRFHDMSKYHFYIFGDDEKFDKISDSLLQVRDEKFIASALLNVITTARSEQTKNEVSGIVFSVLKQKPKAASYNILEGLYREVPHDQKYQVASKLIKKYPEKAPLLFLDIIKDDIGVIPTIDKFYAIRHYGEAIEQGVVKQKEGIDNLISTLNDSDDFIILTSCVETLSKSCGEEGKIALANEIEKEIYLSSPPESLKPYKLAILTWISGCSDDALSTLREVFSRKYKNDALVKAYMSMDKTKVFYIDKHNKDRVMYHFGKCYDHSFVEIFSNIGLDNLLELASSENENIRINILDVFEKSIELASQHELWTFNHNLMWAHVFKKHADHKGDRMIAKLTCMLINREEPKGEIEIDLD